MVTLACTSCAKIWKTDDPKNHPNCPACGGTLTPKPAVTPAAETRPGGEPEMAHAGWSPRWTASLIALAFLIIGGMAIAAIVASSKGTPTNPSTESPPTAQAIKRDQPAASTTPAPAVNPPPKTPATLTPAELFAAASPAVVRVVVRDKDFKVLALGSGFFVSADGLLVTNFHVIKGAQFATVLLSNESTFFVDGIASTDEANDLALLKVNGAKLPFLKMADDAPPLPGWEAVGPEVGTKVYAIGNPEGLTNTFSEGMVSGLRDLNQKVVSIQTTAPISPGSSGGPILTADGRVVGVTSAYLEGGQNLNFAVPVAKVVQLLKNRGKLTALASAGAKSLDKEASAELDKVWDAIDQKDCRLALSILAKLRADSEGSPYYWATMGYAQDQLHNYDMALDAYKRWLKLQPESAPAYFAAGVAYYHQGKYAEAVAAFKSAIAIEPGDAAPYRAIGFAYGAQKNYPQAVAAYKSAIAIDPNDARAYVGMGDAYRMQRNYPEATTAYKSAIEIEPDNADAYKMMGLAYARQRNHTEAIAAYKTAIAIQPDDADAYLMTGLSYSEQGNDSEAAAAFRKAIELDPDGETGRMARENMEAGNKTRSLRP